VRGVYYYFFICVYLYLFLQDSSWYFTFFYKTLRCCCVVCYGLFMCSSCLLLFICVFCFVLCCYFIVFDLFWFVSWVFVMVLVCVYVFMCFLFLFCLVLLCLLYLLYDLPLLCFCCCLPLHPAHELRNVLFKKYRVSISISYRIGLRVWVPISYFWEPKMGIFFRSILVRFRFAGHLRFPLLLWLISLHFCDTTCPRHQMKPRRRWCKQIACDQKRYPIMPTKKGRAPHAPRCDKKCPPGSELGCRNLRNWESHQN